jgi:hypothetical protein
MPTVLLCLSWNEYRSKGFWRKWSCPILRHYVCICLYGVTKKHDENICQVNLLSGRDLNWEPNRLVYSYPYVFAAGVQCITKTSFITFCLYHMALKNLFRSPLFFDLMLASYWIPARSTVPPIACSLLIKYPPALSVLPVTLFASHSSPYLCKDPKTHHS